MSFVKKQLFLLIPIIILLFLAGIQIATATPSDGDLSGINAIDDSSTTSDGLKLISATVKNGDQDAPVDQILTLGFNHRLDPCDNNFSISGGTASVVSWKIKGTTLNINLNTELNYGTEYALNLDGLSDIYGNDYSCSIVAFKTRKIEVSDVGFVNKDGETIYEMDPSHSGYYAELTNPSSSDETIRFVMTLTNIEEGRMEDVITEEITIESGETFVLDKYFENLGEDISKYSIKVFYFKDFETMKPYGTNILPMLNLLPPEPEQENEAE